jgi:hypothetical protein
MIIRGTGALDSTTRRSVSYLLRHIVCSLKSYWVNEWVSQPANVFVISSLTYLQIGKCHERQAVTAYTHIAWVIIGTLDTTFSFWALTFEAAGDVETSTHPTQIEISATFINVFCAVHSFISCKSCLSTVVFKLGSAKTSQGSCEILMKPWEFCVF